MLCKALALGEDIIPALESFLLFLTKNNKQLLQVLKQRLIKGALWDEVGKKAVVKMVRFAWGNKIRRCFPESDM